MRRLLWLAPVAGCLLLLGFLGCSRPEDPWASVPGGPPRVVVTIAPLASFVRGVAGDRAAVICLCTTLGPHEYRADFRDARAMKKADVIFAVGLELDDVRCADALHRMSNRGDALPVVRLGDKLRADGAVRKMRDHKHDDNPDAPAHHHGDFDPHVWLGIPEALAMIDQIRDKLCEIDSGHAAEYRSNAATYQGRLRALHEDGRKRLAGKQNKRIVSFHDAFEYFAASFGLTIADVIELSPGVAPSQGHIVSLQKLCREQKIAAITVEPQYPDSTSARSLQTALKAGGTDVALVTIDPLETAEAKELEAEGADWYLNRMRRNVAQLDEVLR
jgi:ABC-type Zn uptake system ZnuABC Zn-binding protein ZnuA